LIHPSNFLSPSIHPSIEFSLFILPRHLSMHPSIG
jgi:hypothetical protein